MAPPTAFVMQHAHSWLVSPDGKYGNTVSNDRREITEKIRDKEARRFQKTRKATAKMGGLCQEISEKGRGGRKVEGKGQQQGPVETNYKSSRTAE